MFSQELKERLEESVKQTLNECQNVGNSEIIALKCIIKLLLVIGSEIGKDVGMLEISHEEKIHWQHKMDPGELKINIFFKLGEKLCKMIIISPTSLYAILSDKLAITWE